MVTLFEMAPGVVLWTVSAPYIEVLVFCKLPSDLRDGAAGSEDSINESTSIMYESF